MPTRTVTGTWTYPDGTPATGEVVFNPVMRDRDGWVNPGGIGQPAAPMGVTLDQTGTISVDLPVTPDTEEWVWLVIERIVGGRVAAYPLHLSKDQKPLDLADVTPDTSWPYGWQHNWCRCAPQWGHGWWGCR